MDYLQSRTYLCSYRKIKKNLRIWSLQHASWQEKFGICSKKGKIQSFKNVYVAIFAAAFFPASGRYGPFQLLI